MRRYMEKYRVVIVLLCLCLASGVSDAFAQSSYQIHKRADELMATLASMPYASEGSGNALYVFEFSECPYCQAFERDWGGNLSGVELRRFFYAVSDRSTNETAALALSRKTSDFKAMMAGTMRAPDARKSDQSIDAYNSVIAPLNNVVMPILVANGWPSKNPFSPMFIWKSNGQVWAYAGYVKDAFESSVLPSVRPEIDGSAQLPDK